MHMYCHFVFVSRGREVIAMRSSYLLGHCDQLGVFIAQAKMNLLFIWEIHFLSLRCMWPKKWLLCILFDRLNVSWNPVSWKLRLINHGTLIHQFNLLLEWYKNRQCNFLICHREAVMLQHRASHSWLNFELTLRWRCSREISLFFLSRLWWHSLCL